MNLILLGAPGAGKGTLAGPLIEKMGIPSVSTGNLLREAIANGTELGLKAKQFMDAGQLVPDQLVIDMLKDRIAQPDCAKGYILDGFPRTIPQAEALKSMLAERHTQVAGMLELQVPNDMLMERLINRGKTSGRADDNEETIRKRLTVYEDQTKPLIAWYEKEGLRHAVKGYGALEEINAALCEVIDSL